MAFSGKLGVAIYSPYRQGDRTLVRVSAAYSFLPLSSGSWDEHEPLLLPHRYNSLRRRPWRKPSGVTLPGCGQPVPIPTPASSTPRISWSLT